jgi:hypothetical protein
MPAKNTSYLDFKDSKIQKVPAKIQKVPAKIQKVPVSGAHAF